MKRYIRSSEDSTLRQLGITKEQLAEVQDYCDNWDGNQEVGFESPQWDNLWICDIFKDEDGYPAYDINQAVEVYGLENVRNFCKQALRYKRTHKL